MNPLDYNALYGNQAVAEAVYATAHNEGETVLEHIEYGNVVAIKMSSWPRAMEAGRRFEALGWQWRMGENNMGQWIEVRKPQ